jgi:dolichyl-phosphate-mannose-protein mannosyltransferase
LLTITALSIVFFSIATYNLGMTQTPVTIEEFSPGGGFIVNFGSAIDVKSVNLLLKDGHFNITISAGSPNNWQVIASNILYPYNQGQQTWSLDYYKWYEINIQQNTQYIKIIFNESPSSAQISEIAVINLYNQQISIENINTLDSENQSFSNLVDEQDKVLYPATYMTQTYFDEIYYVRSAEQYLNLQVPYEWTHPPLGKLLIAAAIAVFGYSPFGWRIMGVIAATLMIPVLYVLGKKLLGTWIGASMAAFLLTFDFMHFTMARMATIDTYVVFFSLTSQLFFLVYLKDVLKNGWKAPIQPLFLAFIFFALGFSTKWFVLYGFVAQLAILIAIRLIEVAKQKKGWVERLNTFSDHPYTFVFGFLLVAVLIYFLTYIPDMLAGRSLIEVISLQGSMYSYHSTLTATHAFSSPWWSWPLMLKPLWLSVSYLPDNFISTIVLLGNPAVWWVGFTCLIGISFFVSVKILKNGDKRLANIGLPKMFILILFFFQWFPYMLISRITFIYHFYVNVPFLCLASAYFISKNWSSNWIKVATIAYIVITIVMFGLFYPVISGMPASDSWIHNLKWFESWVF